MGDEILMQISGDNQAWIEEILPRRNLLYRSDALRSKLFAANLDLVVLVLAASPPFSTELLGRTLLACHNAQVPLNLIFNKIDLFEDREQELKNIQESLKKWTLGEIPVHSLSAKSGTQEAKAYTLELLTPLFENKTTLILGQSGMGKSTLINLLIPDALLPTNDISIALNAGKHTTTHTQMHFGTNGIRLIDSPGFQAFGLHHLSETDLLNGFSDIAEYAQRCHFANCQHAHEPSCAVKNALNEGALFEPRQALYQMLKTELEEVRNKY